jgi:hypothetical protein
MTGPSTSGTSITGVFGWLAGLGAIPGTTIVICAWAVTFDNSPVNCPSRLAFPRVSRMTLDASLVLQLYLDRAMLEV